MSAARRAAEAAFADLGSRPDPQPAAAVVIEVRPRRLITAAPADGHPPDAGEAQVPPGERLPRVFRMEAALRQAMGLTNAAVDSSGAADSNALEPSPKRRRRPVRSPVKIVQAAAAAVPQAARPEPEPAAMSGHWAPVAQALARLDATLAAIRAAQAFNTFADVHLPPGVAAARSEDAVPPSQP